ncbi:MAG: 3-dehydroquinate synthase [Chloroflexota bacterium]|nr:3-dehydroquinate synthase [Chloroflexota bacterium]MDE2946972.1 3-dehydroquinate synthase [Chloroflexota bacterium]
MNFATNIVLTGFMGAGKTTVGQILARKLKREFVDMDALIEERAGMTIPQIFQRRGEDEFRALERRLVYELALRNGLVIATGGGALIDDDMRETMVRSGMVLCLNASKADIRARLAENEHRPLAAGWEGLLEARASAYAQMPYQIQTTGKTPEEIAGEIAALDGGALYAHTPDGGGYPIIVGSGLLDWLAGEAESLGLAGHVVVVSNETVTPLYAETLVRNLPNANLIVVPDGEAHKNLNTVRGIYDDLLMLGADRGTTLVALGGGVIGDTAGFAAATYMRGIPLVQIPTTLLSMVDSSVGGKVGVDLPQGKNLIGAFKQPRRVIIDTDVLNSLPPLQWRCGMAEVVKHGLIARPALLDSDLWNLENAERLVRGAVQVKIDVVEVDPYERGIRAHLNLGHTFGHAIEKVTEYAIPHGEAVAIGIVKAARLSRNLGFVDDGLVEQILKIMWQLELPTDIALDPERWYAAMSTDKKWKAGRSRLVVLKRLGEAAVVEGLSKEEICAVL